MLLLALLACSSPDADTAAPVAAGEPVDLLPLVDPFISTGGLGFSVGSGYPGATRPFGLVKLSPDTADSVGSDAGYHRGGGYHYDDTWVQGFSHMHMHGIGVTDYGVLAVMPVDRGDPAGGLPPELTVEGGYRALLDHSREEARPGWYRLGLDQPEVDVSLTTTTRTGLHRYRFGESVAAPTLIVDLGHALGSSRVHSAWVEVDPQAGTLQGELVMDGELTAPFTVWFAARTDVLPERWGTWQGAQVSDSDPSGITVMDRATSASRDVVKDADGEAEHQRVGAWLGFPAGTEDVHLQVGISTVDLDGAWLNLETEATSWSPEGVADDARSEWRQALSPVRIWGGEADDRVIFATALYHSLQMPTIYSDVDGRYRGFDDQVHLADHLYHTDYSLWDTYRTLHPLLTLLWPDRHHDILASFARMVEDGGNVPRWAAATSDSETMLGTPANIVWAEAWRKGLRGWGEEIVAPRAIDIALGRYSPAYGGRPDVTWTGTLGYYPADQVGRSVAWTQETAISDYALAEVAADLGSTWDGVELRSRSEAWKRLYNPETGWIQGRETDGSWRNLPSPEIWDDVYAEGNARQYLWLAPQDPEALFEVLGGEEIALARLTEMMEGTAAEEADRLEVVPNSWYWHGNEPSLHIPWMFGLAGRPDLGRVWVRWVMDTYYGTGPDGITGNDDAGTSSAWFAFAAMGIYPLAGTERYVLGLPAFERIELDLGGDVFTITSDVDPLAGDQPVEIALDGTPWPAPHLSHAHLRPGGWLHFGTGG